MTRGHGRRLADRLLAICEADLSGREDRQARPLVLATVDLEALVDQTRAPGWLLHTLTGGRMKVPAAALQRLVDERGADLRTIVLDDLDDLGEIVGVGDRSYVAPEWMKHAIWARDTVLRDRDGSTPVRRADPTT